MKDLRSIPSLQTTTAPASPDAGSPLDRAHALTVLTTEHSSLVAARSLVYNESFARGGMFLTFLSATLVALGLLSTATGLSRNLIEIGVVILGVDLFVGVATMGRIATATGEDLRLLQGMNRLRHAYHDIVPGLEHYFVTGKHDDLGSVFEVYGAPLSTSTLSAALHGFTTVPGMVGVICATIAAAEAALIGALLGLAVEASIVLSAFVLIAGVGISIATMNTSIGRLQRRADIRFPARPPAER